MALSSRMLRPTPVGWAYVVGVFLQLDFGFVSVLPWPILLAALLAFPFSVLALPAFYVVAGLLGLVLGSDESSGSSGSGSCGPIGECDAVTSGDGTTWLAVTTDVVGILALTAAALLNAVLWRSVATARRRKAAAVSTRAR